MRKYNGVTDVYNTMVRPLFKIIEKRFKVELDLSLKEKIKAITLALVPFYEYTDYNEKLCIQTSKDIFGWEKPQDTDACSSNCSINSLGIELHKKRYDVHPYTIPLAHDVRMGLVERAEALDAVTAPANNDSILSAIELLGMDYKKLLSNRDENIF